MTNTQLYFAMNNVEDTMTALNGVVHGFEQWMTKKKN